MDAIDGVEARRTTAWARPVGSSGQPRAAGRVRASTAFASSPGLAGRFRAIVSVLCFLAPVAAAAQTPAPADDPPGCAASVCDLTLRDAIGLALARNRPLLNSRLDREVQRFSLDVAEERWSPQVTVGPFASRDRQDDKAGVGARMSLRVPTGGAFALGWDETLSRKFDDAGSQTFSFSQPLLKGAWGDIDSATVRQARLAERIDILAFRQTAADLVVAVIGAYRALIGAVRQVEIGEASLQRAREQLEATRALIGAGRVAEREAGRSEAAIATRELALVRARNRLEAAQFALIDILELDSRIRIRPLEELKAGQQDAAFAPTLEEALQNRVDYLQAGLGVEIAKIALTVARNNLLPDVALSFRWTHNDTGRTDSEVRLDATVPLNDRTPELERLRARNALKKAERSVVELRESIGTALRQALNDVEVGLRLTELARDARVLAEQNLAVEEAKFGQGLSSTFEVASAEEELVQAEQAEADAILSYLDALTRLDRTSGRVLDRWDVRLEAAAQ